MLEQIKLPPHSTRTSISELPSKKIKLVLGTSSPYFFALKLVKSILWVGGVLGSEVVTDTITSTSSENIFLLKGLWH